MLIGTEHFIHIDFLFIDILTVQQNGGHRGNIFNEEYIINYLKTINNGLLYVHEFDLTTIFPL